MSAPDVQGFIDRFVGVCQADDRVVAALLVGSRADGTADGHSDLDLHVITSDLAHAAFMASRTDFARALGDPLFLEDFEIPRMAFAIYADGTELELTIVPVADLNLSGPYRVLLDKAGVIGPAAARPPAPPAVDLETIRRQVNWFWHDLSHFIAATGRGQLWWAYGQLDDLRRYCLNLARLDTDPAEEPEGYWKVEHFLAEGDLAALRATVVPMERDAMLAAAQAVLALYRERAERLSREHGLAYPARLDRLLSARLGDLARHQLSSE